MNSQKNISPKKKPSFFNQLPGRERTEILRQAVRAANDEQADMVRKYGCVVKV